MIFVPENQELATFSGAFANGFEDNETSGS
jgi:hypothetical protein